MNLSCKKNSEKCFIDYISVHFASKVKMTVTHQNPQPPAGRSTGQIIETCKEVPQLFPDFSLSVVLFELERYFSLKQICLFHKFLMKLLLRVTYFQRAFNKNFCLKNVGPYTVQEIKQNYFQIELLKEKTPTNVEYQLCLSKESNHPTLTF